MCTVTYRIKNMYMHASGLYKYGMMQYCIHVYILYSGSVYAHTFLIHNTFNPYTCHF